MDSAREMIDRLDRLCWRLQLAEDVLADCQTALIEAQAVIAHQNKELEELKK